MRLSPEPLAVLQAAVRVLRTLGAREHDPSDAGRARFINALAADAPELIAMAAWPWSTPGGACLDGQIPERPSRAGP